MVIIAYEYIEYKLFGINLSKRNPRELTVSNQISKYNQISGDIQFVCIDDLHGLHWLHLEVVRDDL